MTQTAEKVLAQHFSLNGRISVRVNDRLDSGQIRWYRGTDEERIGLYSPLGSQIAELVSDARTRTVTLRQGRETTSAATVAALTQSLLGVPLDLDHMAAWAQGVGLVENEATDITFGNGDVWRVRAEHYQSVGNHQFASRVIATSGDIVVRLVIDEWTPQ
ncbi:MAG: outer membrane lipoprotein LolB [Burkholderiales bacterium]|nr:outer membrane lipoprotein LolB [Burkholderiales bacterium]